MKRKYKTRKERRQQILTLFDVFQPGELTSVEVAKVLNLSYSTYVRQLLSELVAMGELDYRLVTHRPDQMKALYSRSES